MKKSNQARANRSGLHNSQQPQTPKGKPAPGTPEKYTSVRLKVRPYVAENPNKPAPPETDSLKQSACVGDWGLKCDGPLSFSLTNGTETKPLSLDAAATFYLNECVPLEFRVLLETHKHDAKNALEDCVQESIGLFALVEMFIDQSLKGEQTYEKDRADLIAAGIFQLTSGFQKRLVAAFNQFYPGEQPQYTLAGRGE